MKYTILLPTLNEEEGLWETVNEIQKVIENTLPGNQFNIVVVDGGSTDKTLINAYHLGCEVVICKEKGKGAGIAQAIRDLPTPDYFIMLDADYTYDFIDTWWYLENIMRNAPTPPQVVRVYRWCFSKGAMPLPNKVANFIMTNFARILYWDLNLEDLCSGFWILKGNLAKTLNIKSKKFTLEAELFVKTRKVKEIHNIPCLYRKRIGGVKKTKPQDAIEICWFLLRNRFKEV